MTTNNPIKYEGKLEYVGGKFFYDKTKDVILDADTGALIDATIITELAGGKTVIIPTTFDIMTYMSSSITTYNCAPNKNYDCKSSAVLLFQHLENLYFMREKSASTMVENYSATGVSNMAYARITSIIEIVKMVINDKLVLQEKEKLSFNIVHVSRYENYSTACYLINTKYNYIILSTGCTSPSCLGNGMGNRCQSNTCPNTNNYVHIIKFPSMQSKCIEGIHCTINSSKSFLTFLMPKQPNFIFDCNTMSAVGYGYVESKGSYHHAHLPKTETQTEQSLIYRDSPLADPPVSSEPKFSLIKNPDKSFKLTAHIEATHEVFEVLVDECAGTIITSMDGLYDVLNDAINKTKPNVSLEWKVKDGTMKINIKANIEYVVMKNFVYTYLRYPRMTSICSVEKSNS
jgi:hypothetical protein